MRQKIDQEASVVMYYSARKKVALPHLISWQNTEYQVGEIGYHHKIREGRTLYHIYELIDVGSNLWFRIKLNTDNLHWTVEAISDGHGD
jgi:hypothetical protein